HARTQRKTDRTSHQYSEPCFAEGEGGAQSCLGGILRRARGEPLELAHCQAADVCLAGEGFGGAPFGEEGGSYIVTGAHSARRSIHARGIRGRGGISR